MTEVIVVTPPPGAAVTIAEVVGVGVGVEVVEVVVGVDVVRTSVVDEIALVVEVVEVVVTGGGDVVVVVGGGGVVVGGGGVGVVVVGGGGGVVVDGGPGGVNLDNCKYDMYDIMDDTYVGVVVEATTDISILSVMRRRTLTERHSHWEKDNNQLSFFTNNYHPFIM